MRFFAFALALFAMAPAPAWPQATASAPTQATVAAARDLLQLVLVDSEIMPIALNEASREVVPMLSAQMRSAPFFASLSPERRNAVLDYLENRYPHVVGEMIDARMPFMLDRSAERIAPLFSEHEMIEIAAFLRTEPVRSAVFRALRSGVVDGASGKGDGGDADDVTYTAEEEAAFDRFSRTPAGRAFERNLDPMMDAMTESIMSDFSSLLPELQLRVAQDVCSVLADECPREFRTGPQPT